MTLAATGILLASTATNGIRLSTSGTNYANLLQNARVRAVRDNVNYAVRRGLRHSRLGGPLHRSHSSQGLYRHQRERQL